MDVGTSQRRRRENELITPDRGQLPPTFPIRPIAHNDAKKAANVELANHYRVPPQYRPMAGKRKQKTGKGCLSKLFLSSLKNYTQTHIHTHSCSFDDVNKSGIL